MRLLFASLLALMICVAPSAAAPGKDCSHGPSGYPGSGAPMGGHFQRCAPPPIPPAPPALPPPTEPPTGPAPPSPPGAAVAPERKAGSRPSAPASVSPLRKPGPREKGQEIPMVEGVADKPWEVSLGMLAWSAALGVSGAGVVLVLKP